MVAIKDFEMPNVCYKCPILDGEYGRCNIIGEPQCDMTEERAKGCPLVEAIPKDQYEARLKADLESILVELQLEIEELDSRAGYSGYGTPTFSTDYIRKEKVNELIQQKINELKENTDGKGA